MNALRPSPLTGAIVLLAAVVGLSIPATTTFPSLRVATPVPPTEVAEATTLLQSTSPGAHLFWFDSPTLGRTMPYVVYLPPGYDSDLGVRYPVLYMLHGLGGTLTEWQRYHLLETADRLILANQIAPLIIVLPQGDTSYWVDHVNGPAWGTYVVRDVVGEVDTHYRTIADRDHRAVGGHSMGGHGALQLAMNHPDVFGIVGAHSPSLRGHEDSPDFFGDEAQFAARDPQTLVLSHPDIARTLRIWMDAGDQDPWLEIDEAFQGRMLDAGIPHAWHVFPGDHYDDYWTANVETYLRYYADALAEPPPPVALAASPPDQEADGDHQPAAATDAQGTDDPSPSRAPVSAAP